MAEKTVAEQVQELTERWNPPPTDHTLERLVGVHTQPGDVAATGHVDHAELNRAFTSDSVDAQRLQEFTDDGDDEKAARKAAKKAAKAAKKAQQGSDEGDGYDAMNGDALKAEIDARNEGREDDARLSKGGKVDELRQRLREDDQQG
jgi:hypothetical protein